MEQLRAGAAAPAEPAEPKAPCSTLDSRHRYWDFGWPRSVPVTWLVAVAQIPPEPGRPAGPRSPDLRGLRTGSFMLGMRSPRLCGTPRAAAGTSGAARGLQTATAVPGTCPPSVVDVSGSGAVPRPSRMLLSPVPRRAVNQLSCCPDSDLSPRKTGELSRGCEQTAVLQGAAAGLPGVPPKSGEEGDEPSKRCSCEARRRVFAG